MASSPQRSTYQGPAASNGGRVGWRGRIGQQAQQIRYRWQRDSASQPLEQLRARDFWRRFWMAGCLLGAIGFVAVLVAVLWFRPVQTPLVAISAPAYALPFPPDAWSGEDLAALRELDADGSGSIHLTDTSAAWQSADSGLANLDTQLHSLARQGNKSGVVILYISMHGAADAAGRPVLLPPGSSPLRSETWLKLSDLLDRIKAQNLPDAWHKLVILDCNRVEVAWNMGILSNGFADGLADAVRDAAIPNLVILNSTSPGQRGWDSADLAGSVFGHFLQLGLAGAADTPVRAANGDAVGGNGDHRVSLLELHHYLQRHVDDWVTRNRADRQQPLLVPAGAADFTVAWSLNHNSQRKMAEAAGGGESSVSAAAIDKLWRANDRIAALHPQRFDPLAWSDFQHKLLWLERAAAAGKTYSAPARSMQRQLQSAADRIEARATKAGEQPSLLARADLFSDRAAHAAQPLVLHSLPLAEYLGDSDARQLIELDGRLARLAKAPTQASVSELLASFPANGRTGQFDELQFLRICQRGLAGAVWDQGTDVGRALDVLAHGQRVAVPDDERAQYWSVPLVAAGNHARRQAGDQMFVGTEAALTAAAPLWTDASGQYAQAEKLTRAVTDALALADQTSAQIPYLAQWLCRPLPAGQPSTAEDTEINDTLLKLIHGAAELNETLAAGPPPDASMTAQAAEFVEQAQQVRGQLEHLQGLLSKECARLEELKKADSLAVRRLEAVLATPLIPARQREDLRKLAVQFATQLNGAAAEGDKAEKAAKSVKSEKVPETADDRERWLVGWHEHPALAILSLDAAAPPVADKHATVEHATGEHTGHATPSDRLAALVEQEQELRERLEALPGELRRLRDIGTAGADGAGKTPSASAAATAAASSASASSAAAHSELDRVGAALNRAALLARAAAPIGLPPLDEDPIRHLRQWNIERLLLWHCRRELEDFWGPAEDSAQPFFSLAAADYLRDIQTLGEAEPAVLAESGRLAKLLESRRMGAADGLSTVASDILLVDPTDRVTIKMAVRPGPAKALAGLPTGEAALFVRDQHGRIANTSRPLDLSQFKVANEIQNPKSKIQNSTEPIPPPPIPPAPNGTSEYSGAMNLDLTVPGVDLADRGPSLQAVALLRGNTFAAPFLLRHTGGVRIDVRPYHYGPPQVTLGGRSRRRASIEFILDCSHSMSELTDFEGPGGTQKISRLEAAKLALSEMLSQLAAERDARVAVRFFGHRVGWNLKKPEELLRQNDYSRPIPDDLRPSEDVELALPLGRFDQIVAGGVLDTMKSLKPWGETPLYLALTEAIGDFADDEPGTDKSIIVITDGANYQFNSPHPKTHADVMAAEGEHKIPIDIVGFGIPAAEAEQAAKEFDALATETDGSFVTVSNGTALVRSLENLLGAKTYVVSGATGGVVGRAEVGATVVVHPKPDGLQPYTVSLGKASIGLELAGGEHAELILGPDSRTIEAVGYEQGDPRFGPLLQGEQGSASGWQLGVHRPVRQQQGVRLPVSIQRTDHEFSPRPTEVWIEVAPRAADKSTPWQPYIYYDANFEPGTSAPVLNLLADDWPAAARQGAVRGWVKFEQTPPCLTVKLADVANRLPSTGTGATIPGLPGVTYQVRMQHGERPGEPYRVAVVERHSADSPGPGSLKVELDPPAARVVHRFDRENHLATHTFYLDDSGDRDVGSYELRFTRFQDLQHGALQLAEPIVRGVSDSGDVIRPTPPGGQ